MSRHLLERADQGDLKGLKQLLADGADPDTRDSFGFTALEYANNAYPHLQDKDHLALVKALVEAGADVNARANNGQTPLFNAAADGRHDVVVFLLEQGADISARLETGETAFHDIAKGIVNRPLNYKVTIKRDGKAITLTDPDEIRRETGSHPDDEFQARLETAKHLVEQGLDLTVVTHKTRQNALFSAAGLGAGEIVDLILEAGTVDVNQGDIWGLRPLHYACREGQTDVVDRLVRGGANVNAQDDMGFTPLHEAAEQGRIELAKKLLELGADPSLSLIKPFDPYPKGATPLDVARKANKNKVAELLDGL